MLHYERQGSRRDLRAFLAPLAAILVAASGLAIAVGATAAGPTGPGASTGPGSGATTASTGPIGTISDGQTISTQLPLPSTLHDTITYGSGIDGIRTYTIHLTATVQLPLSLVTVTTFPLTQWGLPKQMPGGVDNLPPLSLWNWTITDDGVGVTALWTITHWDSMFTGVTTWTTQTITFRGSTSPKVSLTVSPTEHDGAYAPYVGLVMNTPGSPGIPANDSTFTSTAAALDPKIVRISTSEALVSYKWDPKTRQPIFNFTYFDQLFAFASAVGAKVLVSTPAGTWGDGNVLPHGMPVNRTLPVPGPAGNGYLVGNDAYVSYLDGILNHTIAEHESVAYWSIGNEFPTKNQSLVTAYTNLFNLAAATIHARLPSASVGSDVMTNGTYETYFAEHAKGVDFLSFHYYPSATMCVVNGTYCAPQGSPLGSTDVGIFSHTAYRFLVIDNSPPAAQGLWHNLTGKWLPIFNTETNLNPVGGSYAGQTLGSDPRTQTLFGATWLISVLIDSAFANVSQVDYNSFSSGWGVPSTLTTSYGGWGYGLTDEAANGSNVLYAPYFAMRMWTDAIPGGAPGLEAVSSQPDVVHVFAAIDGSNLSVVIENRVNVKVQVSLDLTSSAYHLTTITRLDRTTYGMVYEPKFQTTVLRKAGVDLVTDPTTASVTINGYGEAVATYSLSEGLPPHAHASHRTAGHAVHRSASDAAAPIGLVPGADVGGLLTVAPPIGDRLPAGPALSGSAAAVPPIFATADPIRLRAP